MVDAGVAYSEGEFDNKNREPFNKRSTDIVKARNSSGTDLTQGQILTIDGKVLTTMEQEFPWVDGLAIDAAKPFGILRYAMGRDDISEIQTTGTCVALVNITDVNHGYADAVNSNHTLQSGGGGPVQILWHPGTTGEAICLVRILGDSLTKRIRFKAKARIVGRIVSAEVNFVQGLAINPEDGESLEFGDTVNIHDPHNLFPEIEKDCIGTAYFRPATEADEPTAGDPATVARWEIEDCSLPINKLSGQLVGCMPKCANGGVVRLWNPYYFPGGSYPGATNCNNPGGRVDHFKKSQQNGTTLPPEIDFEGLQYKDFFVLNSEDLDGMPGSEVTIERTTNALPSEADNIITPRVGSATQALWRITAVKTRKARWIGGKWEQSGPTIEWWADGDNPTPCGYNVVARAGIPCPIWGQYYQAAYDPEADEYFLCATQSAWMGSPEAIPLVDGGESASDADGPYFEDCRLYYDRQYVFAWKCGSEPATKHTDIELIERTVIDDVQISNNDWIFSTEKHWVCAWEASTDITIEGTDCQAYGT